MATMINNNPSLFNKGDGLTIQGNMFQISTHIKNSLAQLMESNYPTNPDTLLVTSALKHLSNVNDIGNCVWINTSTGIIVATRESIDVVRIDRCLYYGRAYIKKISQIINNNFCNSIELMREEEGLPF